MFKKTTWLSLATAAVVVVTSAGTFAVYDKTTATASTTAVTLRKPVTVETTNFAMNSDEGTLTVYPSASGDVTFTIEDESDLAKQLDLEIAVKGDSGLSTSDFTFEVTQSGGGSVSGSGTSFTDTDIQASNTYTIKATVSSENVADKVAADTPIQFDVTATLS
ncbi:hypothetical protein [uncultured Ruthenibacterium sp.]|uniref:hypothetical protein n=1 Tax=uncultured Ruthenibacterium sp. TaxID=1905347 RepID=UPI00349F0324